MTTTLAELERKIEEVEALARRGVHGSAQQTQVGRVQLGNGVSPAIAARISAASRIVVTKAIRSGDVGTVDYCALDADRVVGAPGSFKITALDAAGAIQIGDDSTIDYHIID